MEKRSARSLSFRARSSTSWRDAGRAVALLSLAILLGACGFTPLYADRNDSAVVADLAMLDVHAPDSRLGRGLKYNLLDLLSSSGNPPANPAYLVELAPIVYNEDLAIEEDAEVTRKNLVMVVPFRLVDTATKKTLLRSTSRSRSSYNRVQSEFANIVAAQNAEDRIARALAADIKLQLSIYFDRARTGS